MRWLFPDKEVRIDTRCLDCGEPITIRMKDDEILEIDPPTVVGHMNNSFAEQLKGEISNKFGCSQMNLFRSEEHVKNWSYYDPASDESIMSLADWAQVFSGPLFRNRLEADSLARNEQNVPALFGALAELGKTGTFWVP